MIDFAGQVAVVTGASSGIGASLSRQLGEANARLGLIALPGTGLEEVAEAIVAKGGTALAIAADVSDRAAFRAALERLTHELGPIDLLILNAGIGIITAVSAFSSDDIEKLLRVNVLGVVYGIEAVLPQMIERRRGHIVGISSLSSYRGSPFFSGYHATKAAIATLFEGLRVELRTMQTGVRITTVYPGFVRTPMTSFIRNQRVLVEAESAARSILKGIAQQRPVIKFPWAAVVVASLNRLLPCELHDRLACAFIARLARASKKTKSPSSRL